MKIYAKQVPPEFQESPLFFAEGFPDNIAVFGNRDYRERCPETFTRAREALESGELLEAWEDINAGGGGYYYNWASALVMLVPPENREPYTRDERKNRWPDIAHNYYCARRGSYEELKALCDALELMTGEPWDAATIRGCSQGEWQNICFPVNTWSNEAIAEFETMYFNTGTEWIIHDADAEPESPDDIDGFSHYVTEWRDDDIRRSIAEAYGQPAAEVVLYKFDGWRRSANYTEV